MKKINLIVLVVISLFISITKVNADVTTYERTQENHYGVNKKWQITEFNKSNVINTPYVDASEKIYDFANILTEEEILTLKNKILSFIDKYNTEIVILTIDKAYSYDSYNETIAADFYDYNDFGLDNDSYDGILFLRNANSADPYYDMYTFGDAQLYFNQSRYDYILDSIYSDISSKRYESGLTKFINYVSSYYESGKSSAYKYAYVDDMGYIKYKYQPPFFWASIIGIIIASITVGILSSKNKMVKSATKADAYLDISTVNYKKRENKFVNSHTTSYVISSSSGGGYSGGGGHSSSGSSGGGHSSGGGRHG